MAKRKKLQQALEQAYELLKRAPCVQSCDQGVIQYSEDEFEQCRWCYEVDAIRIIAGIEGPKEEVKAEEPVAAFDDLPF